MPDQDPERWLKLCSLATTERDPDKLMALVAEITRLLDAKQQRLKALTATTQGSHNEDC